MGGSRCKRASQRGSHVGRGYERWRQLALRPQHLLPGGGKAVLQMLLIFVARAAR
jgi:hypothetical protein